MNAVAINRKIFLNSLNRLRVQLFGALALQIFGITPETGENELASLAADWSARRVVSATDSANESGFWQFQIAAKDDWQTSQAYLLKAVALKIGDRRWKVKKVEKPIGNAKVWKLRAEIQ
jgi:hypothetical protein